MQIPTIIIDVDLRLIPLTMNYALDMFTLVDQHRAYLRRWQNWPDTITTLKQMQQLIRQNKRKSANDHGFDLIVQYRGQAVGKIGLVFIDWRKGNAEIGYWLAQSYEGQGLITRSCRGLIHHAFTEMGLTCIRIRCAGENVRSRAIPERLGFKNKGPLPYQANIHGKLYDELMFSLSKSNWDARMIYHITTKQAWADAQAHGQYTAASLEAQGFIHLSANGDQVVRVANAIYAGQTDLVILCVDPTQLRAPLKYEPADPGVPAEHDDGERFPHLYGPLELHAVLEVVAFPPLGDGTFVMPDGFSG